MSNKLTIDDKIVVALMTAINGSDKIGTTVDLKPIYTPQFLKKVNDKIVWFRDLIMDKINESVGFNWIIHFEEFVQSPQVYDVFIKCDDKQNFVKITDILKDVVKGVKFNQILYGGKLPPQIERQ